MKKTILILSMIMMGISIFTSCEKEKEEPINELKLSKKSISLVVGAKVEVTITDGNGGYKVSSDDKVTTSIKDNIITIEAVKSGKSTVVITDAKQKTITIDVTVNIKDVALALSNISIKQGENTEVEITAGSGSYKASIAKGKDVAEVKIEGNKLIINALKTGEVEIIITDTKTNKKTKITVQVTVETPDIKLSIGDVGVKKGDTTEVNITAGSGKYTATADNDNVSVKVDDATVIITGVKVGTSKVTVKDTETDKTAEITVSVTEQIPDIKLNADTVKVKVDKNAEVEITAGSGNYTVAADNDNVAVKISESKVIITGAKTGTSKVTVTDTETGKTAAITVIIAEEIPDIALSTDNVEVEEGKNAEVDITAGSGDYTVQAENTNVTATISGTKVMITGNTEGNAKVTVTDTETGKTAEINVVVSKATVALAISEDGFIDYQGAKEVRIYNKIVLDVNTSDKQEKTVQITSGSGDYELSFESGSGLINAVIEGGNTIKISSKNEESGEAIVVLTDRVSSQEKRIKVRVLIPLKMSNTSTMEIFTNLENTDVTFLNYFTSDDANYDHIQVSSNNESIATVTKHISEPYMGIKVQAGSSTGNATLTITDQLTTTTIDVEVTQSTTPFKVIDAMSFQEVSGPINVVVENGVMLQIQGSGGYELTTDNSDLISYTDVDNYGYLTVNANAIGTAYLTIKDKSKNETKTITLNITQGFTVVFSSDDGATFDGVSIYEEDRDMEGTITMSVGNTGTFTLTNGENYSVWQHRANGNEDVVTYSDPDGTGVCNITAMKTGTIYLRLGGEQGGFPIYKYYKIVVQ